MNSLEEKYIYPYQNGPHVWFRFIDDVWGIFWGTEEELKEFVNFCNNFHETIKFTVEYSKKSITFLDVTTYQEDNQIKSTLFVKPTDSHSYLDYSSCHPQSTKSGIPYSQFLRIRRNCTEWTEFIKHSVQLNSYLSLRGYPPNLTIPALHRCNAVTQFHTLKGQSKQKETDDNCLFCITEYNPFNPDIRKWIDELWPILYRSSGTWMLVDKRIIFGHSIPESLQDMLVHTNIFGEKRYKNKAPICNRKWKCRHCPKIDRSGEVTSTSTGRKYRSQVLVSCNSRNLIYLIQCQICKIQYVGQTKNKILQ